MTRFERVNPAVMSRNPKTTTDIATPSNRSTIKSENRGLTTGRTARCVIWAERVVGNSPYRISALEREKRLRDVSLDERDTSSFSDKRDELEVVDVNSRPV